MVLRASHSLSDVIRESLSQSGWTDVSVHHNGHTWSAHRFILATTSPVLGQCFLTTNETADSLIFDSNFASSDIDQLLEYAYGVGDHVPAHLGHLFPSQLQVEPDIKPEPANTQLSQQVSSSSLWSDDTWPHDDLNNKLLYDYDMEEDLDDINNDREELLEEKRREECPYCGRFVSKLAKHVFERHHSDWSHFNKDRKATAGRKREYPKQCPQCDRMLTCKWHYDRHLKTHKEKRERKPRQSKLEDAEDGGPFICVQCGEEFPNKKALKSHEYKHKNEISCDVKDCNEIFLSHLAYSNHMLFKHQKVIKRRKCHAKVKSGNDEDDDKKNAQEEKKHLCTECGRGFREADSLKKHYIFVHTERAIPTCVCNVCGKKFKTNNKLKNHMLLHEPPTLPCPFCDKLFETDHKVKKHIKSTHVEDDQKLYQCNYCQKGFSHFPSYESHMNSHKNVRPYQCEHCQNAYQNHFNLQQHVKKNHGILISSNPHD